MSITSLCDKLPESWSLDFIGNRYTVLDEDGEIVAQAETIEEVERQVRISIKLAVDYMAQVASVSLVLSTQGAGEA